MLAIATEEAAVNENASQLNEEPPLKKVLRVEDNNNLGIAICTVLSLGFHFESSLLFLADSPRKCRARFGMDQQHMWCNPCR